MVSPLMIRAIKAVLRWSHWASSSAYCKDRPLKWLTCECSISLSHSHLHVYSRLSPYFFPIGDCSRCITLCWTSTGKLWSRLTIKISGQRFCMEKQNIELNLRSKASDPCQRLGNVLSKPLCSTCFEQRVSRRWSPEVPSDLRCSVVLSDEVH